MTDEEDEPSTRGASPRSWRFVRLVVRLLLRSQFGRLEVTGAEHVPPQGGALLVANHNTALVDPMALVHAAPRPTSFLAKAPLWKWFPLRPFLNGVAAIPVYRSEDTDENEGRSVRANVETFRRCRERLRAGASLALFPEGASHPQPTLLPLRTGAARIAIDAGAPVAVCPVGLVAEPGIGGRRGSLLVAFGTPFVVDGAAGHASRRAAIVATTRRIETELKDLLAEASSQGELATLRAMRMVWERERGLGPAPTLAEGHARDRRLASVLARLREERPRDLDRLRAEADAWMRALEQVGVPAEHLGGPRRERGGARSERPGPARTLLLDVPRLLVATPIGWLAAIVTWPVRALGDLLALRAFGGTEDVRALCRMLGGGVVLVALVLGGTIAGILLRSSWVALAFLVGLPALLAFHVAWRDVSLETRARLRSAALLTGSNLRTTLLAHRRALYLRLAQARAAVGEPAGEREVHRDAPTGRAGVPGR